MGRDGGMPRYSLYRLIVRPILMHLDPETAHNLTMRVLIVADRLIAALEWLWLLVWFAVYAVIGVPRQYRTTGATPRHRTRHGATIEDLNPRAQEDHHIE